MSFFDTTFLGNTVQNYIIALGIFIAGIAILKFIEYIIVNKLEKLSKRTKTEIDDAIIYSLEKIGWLFYISLSLFFALQYVELSATVDKWVGFAILIVLVFYATRILQHFFDHILKRVSEKKEQEGGSSIIRLLNVFVRMILWVGALLLLLDNLGVNITTAIAGLGIGGIAIALALQNILGDLFASVSIYLDKPFKIGDFIIVGEHMGIVKHIGIKTTRIESLWGEEIVISNAELTSTRIRNYKRMNTRRIHFDFGVTYGTSNDKLKKILKIVKEIFDKIELADLDRVHFKNFGDSSLVFEVAYIINSNDYNKYMDVQQEFNFALKSAFEKEKIEFAFPTRTVYIEK